MAGYLTRNEYKIGYVTDLEGTYKCWENYLRLSDVFQRNNNGELELKQNCYFVHGGDVCDRGNGDLRILQDLISLKRKHPNNVFFILGNRDVNKLRLPFSLCEGVLAHRPHAYWAPDTTVEADFPLNNIVSKMLWVLKHTMGAPFSFECRRQELQEMNHPTDDMNVLQSYLQLIFPGGLLFEYIKLGQFSVIIEDIMFVHGGITPFQLGYVPPTYNRETGQSQLHTNVADPYLWTQQINAFSKAEITDYETHLADYLAKLNKMSNFEEMKEFLWDSKGGYECSQPGSRLVQCGMGALPDKSPNPGVIYASYLNNGKPVRIDDQVSRWLHSGNLTKVIVGHQPNGDSPFIIDHLGVQTISADSSYSKFVMWQVKDLRKRNFLKDKEEKNPAANVEEFMAVDKYNTTILGITPPDAAKAKPSDKSDTRSDYACNEVVFHFSTHPTVRLNAVSAVPQTQPSSVFIHGVNSLNQSYYSHWDEHIGKETKDNWFVKVGNVEVPEETEKYYLLAQSEGFNFRNKLVRMSEIASHFHN